MGTVATPRQLSKCRAGGTQLKISLGFLHLSKCSYCNYELIYFLTLSCRLLASSIAEGFILCNSSGNHADMHVIGAPRALSHDKKLMSWK